MLTRRQAELLDYIDGQIKACGYCPSFDDMLAAIGGGSKSNVHRLLGQLEGRGFIRRLHGKARSIEVLRRVGDPPADNTAELRRKLKAVCNERDRLRAELAALRERAA